MASTLAHLPKARPAPKAPPRLAPGWLHELHARDTGWPAALLFALSHTPRGKPILLVRAAGPLPMVPCAEALIQLNRDPAQLLIVEAQNANALLRAAHEGARCPTLGGVILETWGPLREYDLVASRRLVLAAEASGVPVMLLRGNAQPRPSAAHTRWQVTPAPSTSALPRLPGAPALTLDLLRQRGGAAGGPWRLEWDETDATFHLASPAIAPGFGAIMAGAVVSLSTLRKGVGPAVDNAA
jgi:protein ImuA